MQTLISIVLTTGATLALCTYVGWGAARLALPESLHPCRPLLVPLLGYAITIWVGYLCVSSLLSLRWALPLLLGAATLLNAVAWMHGGPPRAGWVRAEVGILAICALALLAGALPLLQYGYLTTIGRGWDPESYLPMAQHLVDYPVARIPQAAISPLRGLVSDPPRIGLTLGFSVLQGLTMLVTGQSALATFAPLLALLRALGVLAAYAWMRSSMGLGRIAALLAALLAALGALMLWVAFFNFGMQIASWPLVGLGLVLGLAAVDELARRGWRGWRALLLAGVGLAAIPVAYYPALTVFLPMAAGLGLARAIEVASAPTAEGAGRGRWHVRLRALMPLGAAGIALTAVTLVLALPTLRDYFAGFAFRYSLVAEKIGPDRFIPLSDTLGLTAFRLERGGAQPPDLLVLGAALAAAALGAALLMRPRIAAEARPGAALLRWALVLLPLAAYLGWLQYIRPYEYAFMKTSAYLGAPLWGLLLLGWQRAWDRLVVRWQRALLSALVALPIAAAAWSHALVLAEHGRAPALFGRYLVALEGPAAQMPPGATVLISGDERLVGPNNGLLATILYGRQIWGRVATAYYGLSYWPTGGSPDYALLHAEEHPWPLDLGASEIWRSDALALYRFDPNSWILVGRERLHIDEPPADPFSPAAMAIWRRAGPALSAEPGRPLRIAAADLPSGDMANAGGARAVELTIATLVPQRVRLVLAGNELVIPLEPGVSRVQLRADASGALEIASEAPLSLLAARGLAGAPSDAPPLAPDAVAWLAQAEQRGELISIAVQTAGPAHALRAELTVVEDTFDGPRRLLRALAALPAGAPWVLNYAPARGAVEAISGGAPTPLLASDALAQAPDGRYFGVLTLYSGEERIAQVPLFTAEMAGGQISGFTAVDASIEGAVAGIPLHVGADRRLMLAEALPLDARPAALGQLTLARRPAFPGAPADAALAPGDRLTAQLYWQAAGSDARPLAISLQVIGADDRKIAQWDGVAGGDWRPATGWAAGDRVRQDIPLALDPVAPAGTYRLLLAAYDPETGAPQLIAGQQAVVVGELSVAP